jgi:hypothetical protein
MNGPWRSQETLPWIYSARSGIQRGGIGRSRSHVLGSHADGGTHAIVVGTVDEPIPIVVHPVSTIPLSSSRRRNGGSVLGRTADGRHGTVSIRTVDPSVPVVVPAIVAGYLLGGVRTRSRVRRRSPAHSGTIGVAAVHRTVPVVVPPVAASTLPLLESTLPGVGGRGCIERNLAVLSTSRIVTSHPTG